MWAWVLGSVMVMQHVSQKHALLLVKRSEFNLPENPLNLHNASMTNAPTTSPTPPCVLLTGFEAFGDDRNADVPRNSSWLVAQSLHGQLIANHQLIAAQLPCVFADAGTELLRFVREFQPALVICLGQANDRQVISLERIAININDARIADNAGKQPIDQPVIEGGAAAYFSSVPLKPMLAALQRVGTTSEISQTAGTFVCNHVFYSLMHFLDSTAISVRGMRGGFIHLPPLPEGQTPPMPLEEMVAGLRQVIACALTTPLFPKK